MDHGAGAVGGGPRPAGCEWPEQAWTLRSGVLCVFSGQGGTMTQVTPVATASWCIFSEQLPPLSFYSLLKPPPFAGASSWLRSALGFESGTPEVVLRAGPAVRLATPRQVFPVGAGGARWSRRRLGAGDVEDGIQTLLPASLCSPGLSPVTEGDLGAFC